jgi:hypothetical protein
VVTGSTQQGQTLTVTPGTWTGTPTPTLTYQWTRGGVNISGATATTYVTQVADIGALIRCVETATNTGGVETATSNAITVVAAGAPEVTTHPDDASHLVGETAEFSAACDASPAATYQWQVNDGGGWVNVSTGTGGSGSGNSTTYETATLVSGDNGNLYRCVFTNAGGSATTDEAALSLVVAQDAVRFAGDAAGCYMARDLGGPGHANFTIEMLVYLEARAPIAAILEIGHAGNGRAVMIQHDNTFEQYHPTIGDSQTGNAGGGWGANPPPLNTWLYMTFRSPNTTGGTLEATWTAVEGAEGTTYEATRTNGVEASVQAQRIALNGSGSGTNGSGNGIEGGVRFQYVRGKTGYENDATVAGHRQSVDPTGWEFWWVFEDNGGGGITVRDATGNGRTPTIVSGTLTTGPTIGSVP